MYKESENVKHIADKSQQLTQSYRTSLAFPNGDYGMDATYLILFNQHPSLFAVAVWNSEEGDLGHRRCESCGGGGGEVGVHWLNLVISFTC